MSQGPDPVMRAHYRRRRIKWIVGAVVAAVVLNLACVHHGQTITVEMLSTVGAAAATQPAASQPGD